MNQKTIYIIIGLVAVIAFVLLYQKSQTDKAKLEQAQTALLNQNPNAQFSGGQFGGGWVGLIGQLVAGTTSTLNTPKK